MLVLARFRRSCGIFFASHSSVRPPDSFVVRRWRASRFGRGGWFWPNGEVGVETSLAAASSGDRGALWWVPKSVGFYLGGKKGALWRGSAFCASACRLTSSGGCCVAISVTLRRRAVQHTHFAHGRCEAAASAGSAGIFVSAWTIAGRALPIARVAGLGAFASLSCSGSSPEL